MWYWFDKETNSWVLATENKEIEEEYQHHLDGNRMGQRVYHCFGNGWTACIDFNNMKTYCGSGRCMINHERRGLGNDHMTYKLKRE